MGKLKRGSKKIGRNRKHRTVDKKVKAQSVSPAKQVFLEHAYHSGPAASNPELPEITNAIQGCELPESPETTGELQNCEHQEDGVPESLESGAETQSCDEQDDGVQLEGVDVSACLLTLFHKLKADLEECENKFTALDFNILKCTEKLHIIKFHEYDNDKVAIKYCVTIDTSLTATVNVHGKQLSSNHPVYQSSSTVHRAQDVLQLVSSLNGFCVCTGNSDPELVCNFTPASSVKAYLETNVGGQYNQTVRSVSCPLLIPSPGRRCEDCKTYRSTLRKTKNIKIVESKSPKDERTRIHSSKPNCAMSRDELAEKTRLLKLENKRLTSENKRLRARLLIKQELEESHELEESDNKEVEELVNDASSEIEKLWPDPHSFQRIFWEEQLKYNKLENKASMRWHPLIIKWALLIKSQSSKAYQSMRDLGFVNLPSERTLFDYSHCVPSKLGFVPEVASMLVKEAKDKGLYSKECTMQVCWTTSRRDQNQG